MPGKHSRKVYVKDSFYHVYNRGVEKRTIFKDEQDYKVFLSYIKEYLSPLPELDLDKDADTSRPVTAPRIPNNYHGRVELHAYCLMPNHFHLLLRQTENNYLDKFLHSLQSRYSRYFNRKYDRVGTLYQGRYKAIMVLSDEYLLHLSRYIHLNPKEIKKDLVKWYSSYGDYIGVRNTAWIAKDIILSYFRKPTISRQANKSYQKFVEGEDYEIDISSVSID